MNTLSVGHPAAQALPALSPWIIPVIAVAAKRSCDRTRGAKLLTSRSRRVAKIA